MLINKIKIKNFKSIGGKWEEFTFPLSLNLITGDVGVGKTTVYSAITYALYNKNTDFKGNSKSTLPINRLINDANKKELLVEIELDNGYTIKRGQKPEVFEILKDGDNLANKSVTVDQSFLENTVLGGMTFDIFLSTVYLSNKPGSTPFIHMTNAQRKEYIEKILDLRRLHYYNENLKKYIAENKLERASLDKELQLINETITNEEFNINNQLKKQEEDKQRLEEYIDNHALRIKEQEELLKANEKELERRKDEIQNIVISEDETKIFDDEIAVQKVLLDKISKEDNEDEINKILSLIKDLEKLKSNISFELNMQETDLNTSDELEDEQELLFNSLEKDTIELNQKIQKMKDIKVQRNADYQAYITSKENYHFCGTCPTLEKIVGGFDVENHLSSMDKLVEIISNTEQELNNKTKSKERILYIREKNQKIREYNRNLENQIQNNKALMSDYNEKINQYNEKIKMLKENLIKEKELKTKNVLEVIKNLEDKKENVFNEKKIQLEHNIEKLENLIQYIQDKIVSIKNETEPTIREVETKYLETLEVKKINLKENIDTEYNKSVELDELKKEINSPEHKIKAIKKYIPVFENKLNEILDIFMEDDVFDLKAKLSEEFALTFYKNGKEISVFTLSSGQVACCSLACTFAFLYLLEVKHHNNFSHLLIDELLDLNIGVRIHKVLLYLQSISTNKNISVISHNKTLDIGVFDTITYVSKDDMFSKYTIA